MAAKRSSVVRGRFGVGVTMISSDSPLAGGTGDDSAVLGSKTSPERQTVYFLTEWKRTNAQFGLAHVSVVNLPPPRAAERRSFSRLSSHMFSSSSSSSSEITSELQLPEPLNAVTLYPSSPSSPYQTPPSLPRDTMESLPPNHKKKKASPLGHLPPSLPHREDGMKRRQDREKQRS